MNRYRRIAAEEIVKIADHVEATAVADTALAMMMMYDLDQRRFQSDEALLFQISRRVRGLTDLNCGTWFDHRTGRTKRAYRDLPPKATRVVGTWLVETFGAAGLVLARHEKRLATKEMEEKRKLNAALEELN